MSILKPSKDADGVVRAYYFRCPACGHSHTVRVQPHPEYPGSPLWDWNGSLDQPTFTPSILERSVAYPKGGTPADREEWNRLHAGPTEAFMSSRFGTRCHSFVANGLIDFLSDCTHTLRGKHPIPPYTDLITGDGE